MQGNPETGEEHLAWVRRDLRELVKADAQFGTEEEGECGLR